MAEWLWGTHAVLEALRGANREVEEVWIEGAPDSDALRGIVAAAGRRRAAVRQVGAPEFAGLPVPAGDAQRVVGRCGPFRYRDEAELPAAELATAPCFVVVLDHLQDPQNVGAILRTAEVAGCRGVCMPKRRAVGVTPAVVRASAGASEHLDVFRVANVARVVERLKESGYWTVALDATAEQRWDEVDYRGAVALVVGSEGAGVSRLVLERCDFRVALPTFGRVASLNAGVAFAAVVWEVVRQQLGGARGVSGAS